MRKNQRRSMSSHVVIGEASATIQSGTQFGVDSAHSQAVASLKDATKVIAVKWTRSSLDFLFR